MSGRGPWLGVSVPVAFVLGGLAALAATAAGALLFSQSGLFNVAASQPHSNFVEWITHETMIHSVRARARHIAAPSQVSAAQVVAGFCAYEAHCVMCHGASAVGRQPWVDTMTPDPPYLLDAPRRWTAPQLFWIVKHGIKMTGMPAWQSQLSDAEVWNVVAFLEATNRLPSNTYVRWRSNRTCGPQPPK